MFIHTGRARIVLEVNKFSGFDKFLLSTTPGNTTCAAV